jgi:hypothetical protein
MSEDAPTNEWTLGGLKFSVLETLSSVSLSTPLSRKVFSWDSAFEDVLFKLGLHGRVSHLAPSIHPARYMLLPQNGSSAMIFPSGLITVRSRRTGEAAALLAAKRAVEVASRVSESSAQQGGGPPHIDHMIILLHHLPELRDALDNDLLFFERAAVRLRAGKDTHVEYEPEIVNAFLIRTRNHCVVVFLPDARICVIAKTRAEGLSAVDYACAKLLDCAPVASSTAGAISSAAAAAAKSASASSSSSSALDLPITDTNSPSIASVNILPTAVTFVPIVDSEVIEKKKPTKRKR